MPNNILAFIPARGGSKRLPNKNVKLFCGEPLIGYTIRQAVACKKINRVVVSTDDDKIKEISLNYGAEVVTRPVEFATDYSPTAAAAKHCLNEVQRMGFYPDLFITLQPTSPLRPLKLLYSAIDLYFENRGIDSIITVSVNKQKLGKIIDKRYIPTTYSTGQRSQDLDTLYFENGLIYLTNPDIVNKEQDVFGKNMLPMIVNEFYADIDIDDAFDFELAEFLYTKHKDLFLI